MNIFALHPNPAIAASMHCDQHLHKMILESAQMLSTAAHYWPEDMFTIRSHLYKPAYENHPCTIWCRVPENALWVVNLCLELENIRDELNYSRHSSMNVIDAVSDYLDDFEDCPREHIFCGPYQFRLRPDLDIHQKYQAYYIQKYRLWLDTTHPMSYKGRSLPEFLQPFKDSINHG